MANNSNLVTEEELFQWTHYKTRGPLISWLEKNQIAYFTGKGGRVCTTVLALNNRNSANDDDMEFA